jgi:hypothetical protein
VAGVLTAEGQLALASEFRFDYWHTDRKHYSYTVRRGRGANDSRWAICDGGEFGVYWNGSDWCDPPLGPDAYRYELEEALVIAQRLAFEENQRWIALFEERVGGTRGGPYDMAAGKGKGKG